MRAEEREVEAECSERSPVVARGPEEEAPGRQQGVVYFVPRAPAAFAWARK